ncbi:MAG: WD40 repeat domain-containing protein, partial [Pseudonocardiaceae bacterium]
TITVLSVALIVALTAAGIALIQQDRAQIQQDRTQDGERLAIARQLIAQATTVRLTDPRAAARLGLAAHRIRPDGETRADLINTLTSNPHYANTLTGHTGSVLSVAFAPDGHTLATAGGDDSVILWGLSDPTQPRQLATFGHTGPVYSVAFAPDGHTLATASNDDSVILWDLTELNYFLGHVVERACAIAPGGLGREEWARRISGLPYQETCPA